MFSLSSLLPGSSLPELSESVRRTLSGMQAQIAAAWGVQHHADGTHGDVTATRVRTQRLSLAMNTRTNKTARMFVVDGTGGLQGVPLEIAAGVQFVSIISPASVSYNLYGIRQADVQYGDLLLVRKDPRSQQTIVIQDRMAASVPAGTEIFVSADATTSYPEFYLQQSGVWLPLIYSPGVGTDGVDGWAMFSTTSV